jgi:hypothetical protein
LIESQATLLHIQQYQDDRVIMLDKLDRFEEAERQAKYVSVLEWLSGAQTKLDHGSACNARSEHPGSGSWILMKPELENWKEADTPISSVLWLNGIPGAGMLTLPLGRVKSIMNMHSLLRREDDPSLGYHRRLSA